MLNNILNNDITLIKLLKNISFNFKAKRLYYIRHVLNFIIKVYLYKQDIFNFKIKFKE